MRHSQPLAQRENTAHLTMSRNPTNDFIQFIAGGSLFGGGIFLLANQVMASSAFAYRGGGWGRSPSAPPAWGC
jgi:acyl-coenzyme A thioesterase PaaI-like protein